MHEFEEVNGTDSMAEFHPSRPVSEMQQLLLSNERKLAETNKGKAPEKTEGEKSVAAGDKQQENENSEQKSETEGDKTTAEKPDGSEEGSEHKKSSTEEISMELGEETPKRIKTDAGLAANSDAQPMEVDVGDAGGVKETAREIDDKKQTSLEAADSETVKDNDTIKDITEEKEKSGTAAESEERITEDKIDEDNKVVPDPAYLKEDDVVMEAVGEKDKGSEAAKEEKEQGKESEVKSKAGDEVKNAEDGEKETKESESSKAKDDNSASAKAGKPSVILF